MGGVQVHSLGLGEFSWSRCGYRCHGAPYDRLQFAEEIGPDGSGSLWSDPTKESARTRSGVRGELEILRIRLFYRGSGACESSVGPSEPRVYGRSICDGCELCPR